MIKQVLNFLTIVAFFGVVIITIGCGDKVEIGNSAGNEHGIMVDGQNSGGHVNDRKRVSTATTIDVGDLESSPSNNAIIAITEDRPVAIEQASWTSGDDVEPVNFANKINIPVTVWIVKGPFMTQQLKALNAALYTIDRFNAERVGVGFSEYEIVNRTGMANASNFYHFPSTSDPQDWKDNVGWRDNRINIYYVETVSGSTTTGRAVNFSDFIILGEDFGDIAVVHEIGHSFSARHKSAPDFNTENIMWPFYDTSDPWEYFTEGELFRMHANSTSALNNTYNARPGEPTVSCVGSVSSDVCVDWDKRLWDDGVLTAN